MAKHTIAWMPGDGVGVEVMAAARLVLDRLDLDAEYVPADIGWEFWCTEGNALPDRTVEILKGTDAALFGAITSKPREEADAELEPALRGAGRRYVSPIVRLRQLFDLHTNLRPCKALPGNPLNRLGEDVDLVVFRENTEGMYGGIEWFPLPARVAEAMADPEVGHPGPMAGWLAKGLENVAVSTRIMSRQGCERICRRAFAFARNFGRRSVTLVEKPNVLRETGGLITRVFREVAKDFEGVEAREANIDAMAMLLVTSPGDHDVLVAENMFGDIISDLAAGLTGGLGFAPSANIGDTYAVFEPTHGSAPALAGKNAANPVAMILTVRLMLDWLGELDHAAAVGNAVAEVVREGRVRTFDMLGVAPGAPGAATTTEMAEAVAARL